MQSVSENVEACPVCGQTSSKKYIKCKDYTVSHEEFQIVQCLNCSFLYNNPRPSESEIGRYYQSIEYISHNDTNRGLINKLYHLVRKKTLQNKLDIINSIHEKNRLLDIGCGTGAFLQICERDGWKVNGIEPDTTARSIAEQKIRGTIEQNLLTSYENQIFEIITMWHVLEHVHQLNKTIEKIRTLLSPTGKLVIAVPNVGSYDAAYFKEYWAAYDAPRHLYHFSRRTISILMKKHGMELVEVIPMKFDAYYIGLLSTKYKNSRINYVEGFAQGIKSNLWAKKNENNYSSLTYIFSK